MLHITIEVVPGGDWSRRSKVASMTIYNDDTGDEEQGNYVYELYEQDFVRPVLSGRVLDFQRSMTFPIFRLIRKVLTHIWP